MKKRKWLNILGVFAGLVLLLILAFRLLVHIDPPEIADRHALQWERVQRAENAYAVGPNWLRKNDYGYWEMYLQGAPFERGVAAGKLTKELLKEQEEAFVAEIQHMIPSPAYLRFLKYFVAWFNRNMDHHVPLEYQQEIYGASFSADPAFEFIGPAYQRKLNYHAAHDIGHALQNMNLVACTSFASWGSKSQNNHLLIGRNFDFYVGDQFAKNKIVCFIRPDSGYCHAMLSWPGFFGAVSGMNEKGLTVTLNAAKSTIPTAAATPVAIVAREILQYAANIEEAFAIASSRQTFVSESFLIGSKADGRAVIIEKSPKDIALFEVPGEQIVCANHFQSELFMRDSLNLRHIAESPSLYRQQRVEELLGGYEQLTPQRVAAILRDRFGKEGRDIGMGNEKAINQLIAHHGIMFDPQELVFWPSVAPHQLGPFIAYRLDVAFERAATLQAGESLLIDSLLIPEDTFLTQGGFAKYERFKFLRDAIKAYIAGKGKPLPPAQLAELEALNPHFYYTWWLLGDHAMHGGKAELALQHYRKALSLEVASEYERRAIQQRIKEATGK